MAQTAVGIHSPSSRSGWKSVSGGCVGSWPAALRSPCSGGKGRIPGLARRLQL